MTEEQPFNDPGDADPTPVPLKGPNVISTFDAPPHPDAIRAHDAVIRKHLQDQKPRKERPQG
jgi:hypothetical protein